MKKPAAAEETSEKAAAKAEVTFPWDSEERKTFPGNEERRENRRTHYVSLQKYYAARSGLEESQALPGSDGMATLSEANATAEEEVQTTDEMVDAEASQAFQPKRSQDEEPCSSWYPNFIGHTI